MKAITFVSTVLMLSAAGSPVWSGTITGKVVDTSNRPVVAAIVTISEAPATPSAASAMQAATSTAADGAFSFANLVAGTYLLCSQVPKGTLLNPCQRAKVPPLVTVNSAGATASITLTMSSGYRLPIRIDDPQNLLAANEGKTLGAHLLIGVPGYHFEEATIDSTDNAGRNVSVLGPFDVPVAVTVQSNFFQLPDSAGKPLNKANAIPLTVSSATPFATLNVKVVGNN